MLKEKINELVESAGDWIIELRRELHRNPEPSRKEKWTSEKVISILEELGVEVKTGYYETGVVGIIRGNREGGTIALRFDMDALEMEEKTGLPFTSQNEGLMHACGHDGHTAMGLGAAKVLMQLQDEIEGNVKLIFQPAEEDAPNGGGAQYMIRDGVLSDPVVDAIIGMHIWPALRFGQVGTRVGPIMAASDPFVIDIVGKGVHASLPNLGIDPIVVSAQVINNLQTVVSRYVDPFEPAVVSIGVINGGSRYNTIPDTVTIKGTVRTFSLEVRDIVAARMKSIAEKTAEGAGAKAEVQYTYGYMPTINDKDMVGIAREAVIDMLGEESYVDVERPASGGEDFSYFAREVPGVYLWLGYSKEGEENYPPHSPHFDFDEGVLPIGTRVLVNSVFKWSELWRGKA